MMPMSPEAYEILVLSRKTKEELYAEILRLKRSIGHQKKLIERSIPDIGRIERIYDREYLQRAIKKYEDAGGIYIPSKAEQKLNDFHKNLQYMSSLTFSRGTVSGEYSSYTYTIENGLISIKVRFPSGHTDTLDASVLSLSAGDMFQLIEKTHLGEWKQRYINPDSTETGTQWELKIVYSNGLRPFRSYGCNVYPAGYKQFVFHFGFDEITPTKLARAVYLQQHRKP